jgi:HK97 family phage portal protein
MTRRFSDEALADLDRMFWRREADEAGQAAAQLPVPAQSEARGLEDPSTPFTALALADLLGSVGPTPAGSNVSPESAMRHWLVFACIRVIAETLASLPLQVLKRRGEITDQATEHPLYRVLHDQPNSMLTSYAFREAWVAQSILHGVSYAVIVREGNTAALLLTPPGAIRPKSGFGGRLYQVTLTNGGTEDIDPSELLILPGLTLDGVSGISVVLKAARDLIGEAMATAEHSSRFFSNGARVGGVLSTEQTLKDDAIARLKAQWAATQGGTANAYKTAVLEQGLKYTPTGMQSDHAQLIETRKLLTEQIAGAFRVPPLFIGSYERMTYANAEHNDLHFVKHCITPWCVKIEQEINSKLFGGDRQHFAKFNLRGLLRGDFQTQTDSLVKGVQGGIYTPNEARGYLDLPRMEGGDKLFIQQNMIAVKSLPGSGGTNG